MKDNQLSEDQLNEISDAIVARNKIHAIKIYREATGAGLKEAKEAIEEMASSLVDEEPKLLAKKPSGCASLLIFGLIAGYVVFRFGASYLV